MGKLAMVGHLRLWDLSQKKPGTFGPFFDRNRKDRIRSKAGEVPVFMSLEGDVILHSLFNVCRLALLINDAAILQEDELVFEFRVTLFTRPARWLRR